MAHSTPAYTILSIDGGGIRGIIPCKVLEYIENRLYDKEKQDGPRIAELFDLIAGTSTGGILACGFNIAGDNQRPKYLAKDLLKIYQGESGKKIFSRPTIGRITHFFRSLARAKYPAENIEEVAKHFFGDAKLSQAITDLLITSYNTEAKKPFYFKSSDCRSNPEQEDFPMWEIARSTSAAPTFFPPKKVGYKGIGKSLFGPQSSLDHLALIDGGVFANNPSMLAYIEARNAMRDQGKILSLHTHGLDNTPTTSTKSRGMFAEVEGDDNEVPFFMLSIGTGNTGKTYPYDDVRKWGMVDWVIPLIDILMQGVSETVHYQMEHLLPPYQDGTPRYIRLNIDIQEGHDEMDDPSDENTARLAEYGDKIVNDPKNREALDQVCDLLMNRFRVKNLG